MEASLTNGTSDPTLDEIEVRYQCTLILRIAAGLQFPPLTIVVTSKIISHAMNGSWPTQQIKATDYWFTGVTSVVASHLDPLSATGSVAHEGCSQDVLGQPGSAF